MDCPICFEITDEISLECNHKIHKECLKRLLKSNAPKKCPMCRSHINLDKFNDIHNFNRCNYCNKKINLEGIDFLKNLTCGCIFHYDCFREALIKNNIIDCRDIINCPSCTVETDRYNLEAYSYLYFYESLIKWVGTPPRCTHFENGIQCNNKSSPRKYYKCEIHYTKTRTNRSFYKGLKYIFKYASSLEETDKMKIFCKIVDMWDDNENNIKNLPYNKWIDIL